MFSSYSVFIIEAEPALNHLSKFWGPPQITHLTSFLVPQQPYFRLYLQAEESEYPGINAISLGQNTGNPGKIAHLTGIDDDYWQAADLE